MVYLHRLLATLALASSLSFSSSRNLYRSSSNKLSALLPQQRPSSSLSSQPFTPHKVLELWIDTQRNRSLTYLLDNISPYGANAADAVPGAVLASPSKKDPDYYYQWVRDGAITMGDVADEWNRTQNERLREIVEAYAKHQWEIQRTPNPSGGYEDGGLGEPKFMVDGSAFDGSWGRPQRDGPALRALTLMKYIQFLNSSSPDSLNPSWLSRMYDSALPTHSTIKADLEYVSHTWRQPSFDIWEEKNGLHFFTIMVQHRALLHGRDLAVAMNDLGAAEWYDKQQTEIKAFLTRQDESGEDGFWDAQSGHLRSMLDADGAPMEGRSGLDVSLLLGALHGGAREGDKEGVFAPWSAEVLASLHLLVEDQAKRHEVNRKAPPYYPEEGLRGVGVGRYPEDVYDGVGFSGGNPWFLCTATVADTLYRTITHSLTNGITIDATNQRFFAKIDPSGTAPLGHYAPTSPQTVQYLQTMFSYADSFLNVIRWHATEDGRLSEQFNTKTGFQQGARDLTWSYGSFLMVVESRNVAKTALLAGEVVEGMDWEDEGVCFDEL